MKKEKWRRIKGYKGRYRVSSLGRVRSIDWETPTRRIGWRDTLVKGRILKFTRTNSSCPSNGYFVVGLVKNPDCVKWELVHRLVAKAFIPNPSDKLTVNHKDGDKYNNHVSNLEWMTRSENRQHAYDTGLQHGCKGKRNGMAKLNKRKVRDIRRRLADGEIGSDIARLYKVGPMEISRIKHGIRWGWLK